MDSFKQLFDPSNDIWKRIMEQLIQLREWQQIQEQVVKERQSKQMKSLIEQNNKLKGLSVDSNATSTDDNHIIHTTDDNPTIHSTDDNPINDSIDELVCNQFNESNSICNDSVEEMRTNEDCHQTSGQIFKNNYLEDSAVKPGINGKEVKTFEDLLNIKLNDKNLDFNANQNKPKKPFLRRGEGIKRFESNKSQLKLSSNDNQKSIGLKASQTKPFSDKTRPKVVPKRHNSVKEFVKNKLNKCEESFLKSKQFKRKVIPVTTKFEKIDKKSIQISRDTPTVIIDGLNPTESELFNYLRQMYENISIEDNSIDDNLKDKDINQLQNLLKKIETKREIIEKQFDSNPTENEDNFSGDCQQFQKIYKTNSKKKVHWSHTQTFDEECDEHIDQTITNDLIQPKAGAYSSKLKQQINELENQLTRLKSIKKDKSIDNSVAKDSENSEPINGELIKLRQQIDKLSERIVNIESKAYDMSSTQLKDLTDKKKNSNRYFEPNRNTSSKTISPPTCPNVSVNKVSNDTTIDFPNGDKMNVSKDNTILYSFANGTTQTTFPDGFKIINFPNGQTEKVDKNGVKRITYPNGLQRIINADGSEEVLMTDGTVWRIYSDGSEVLEFSDGDREIRTNKYKRREYRNGNIKTLYSDGTEETRYVSGRLRIKDKSGNLVVDSVAKHLNQHL